MSEKFEFLTIYRGKDIVTYLLSDWEENGENATPLRLVQNPSESTPFREIKMEDIDAVYYHN